MTKRIKTCEQSTLLTFFGESGPKAKEAKFDEGEESVKESKPATPEKSLIVDNSISNESNCIQFNFPDCWDNEQWAYFTQTYSWLIVMNSRLGCEACRSVSNKGGLPVFGYSHGIHMSKEWVNVQIMPSGSYRKFRQKQLRKKFMSTKTVQRIKQPKMF